MEYHGDREADREELAGHELSKWWSQAFMRPGSSLLVCLLTESPLLVGAYTRKHSTELADIPQAIT